MSHGSAISTRSASTGSVSIARSVWAVGLKPSAVRPRIGARSKRKPSTPAASTKWRRLSRISSRTTGWSPASVLPQPVSLTRRAGLVGRVAVVGAAVEAAQRQRRAELVALAGVVEDEIEDDADAGRPERRHRVAQFGHTARREARVERHERDRIVAPGVAQPERAEMALVDPGRHRHQFDGGDAERRQMLDDRRMRQCRDRATDLFRHVRMQHGEGAHLEFVDQAARAEQRRRGGGSAREAARRRPPSASAARCRRAARAARPKRIVDVGPVDLDRVGIHQQLVGIEPEAVAGS